MKSGKKQKPREMKHKIREEKKREGRIGLAVTVAILIIIISVSGFLINSMLNQPSTNQTTSNASQPKAAIVDHLSLSMPNQTFTETATNTLKKAGYTVDYYPGEKVTVEFYRNLPTHGYSIIILRVHSTAALRSGTEYVETSVNLFTSELVSSTKYVYDQLTDRLIRAFYLPYSEGDPSYFGITANFVGDGMKGKFKNAVIIMMGCEGLTNPLMAKAFLDKGAKVYIGWNGPVSASHTDATTISLLQHLIIKEQTVYTALEETFLEKGPDPAYKSLLIYYPFEAGDQTIENITGNPTTKP